MQLEKTQVAFAHVAVSAFNDAASLHQHKLFVMIFRAMQSVIVLFRYYYFSKNKFNILNYNY